MSFFDNIRDRVDDTVDKGRDIASDIRDSVEDNTGINFDRDSGSEDSSGSSSKSDTASESSDSSRDEDPSFDTGGRRSQDSGSSGSGSRNEVNVEPIEMPDRSNEDFEQEGPEKVAVQSAVTVEDQRTSVETGSGETVSRADLINRRDEAEQRRRNLENQEEFLQNLSEGSRVETEQGETVSRREALDRVAQQREEAFSSEQSIRSNIQNFEELSKQQSTRQRHPLDNQVPVTDQDGFFTRLDARTQNTAFGGLTDIIEGTRDNAEIIGRTRPAQFAGQGAAGILSFTSEAADSLTPETRFDSLTEQQLFDNRRRSITTSELEEGLIGFEDGVEFNGFDLEEARTVDQQRVDELAESLSQAPAFAATSILNPEASTDAALGTAARPFTSAARQAEEILTLEDQGSGKVEDFNLGSGIASFGAATAQSAREDPGRFGFEIAGDTLAGTAALRGGRQAGTAATKAPDAALTAGRRADPRTGFGREPLPGENRAGRFRDIEIDELNTVEDFFTGDLTTQTRTVDGKEVIITNDPNAPGVRRRGQETKENVFNTREGEDGVVIDPETQDAIISEQVSRREFVDDLFDIDFSKGQAQLTQRPRQTTDTDALTGITRDRSTSTDVTSPQDRLQDVSRGVDDLLDTGTEAVRRTNQRIVNMPRNRADTLPVTGQTPDQEQTPLFEEELGIAQTQEEAIDEIFMQEEESTQTVDDPFFGRGPETVERFEDPNPLRTGRQGSPRDPENLRSFFPEPERDQELFGSGRNDGISDEFAFDASVGAEILGITAEEAPDAEDIQDPFSLRPVVEENNGNSGGDDRIL